MKTDTGSGPVCRILIVEDNRGDVLLVEVALREAGLRFELIHLADGENAMVYVHELSKAGEYPPVDLVFLDLNLPKRDGWEILEALRSVPLKNPIPVFILSSSNAPQDLARAQLLGVSKYIRKPSTLDEFLAIGQTVKQFWAVSRH